MTLVDLARQARERSYALRPRQLARCAAAYARDRAGRRAYRVLDEQELRATRRSDTAFVFGSGRSLVDIDPEQWARIAEHDTISLREFPRQSFVRVDYHLSAEVDDVEEYARRLRENPLYADTVFVVQEGWLAVSGNTLVGRRLLPHGACIFRFHRTARGRFAPPSRSFSDGLVHGFSSIVDATNLAYLLGYKRIVLAGVDLYNKEYFWLPAGVARTYEKAGIAADDGFAAHADIIGLLAKWRELMAAEGVRLLVYDARSLAARVLDVFDWNEAAA